MIKQIIKNINPDLILWLIVGFVMGLLLGSFVYAEAYAETDYNHIGIEFSNTCLTLIELGDIWTCSTPEEIKTRYLETPIKANWQVMIDNVNRDNAYEYQKTNSVFDNHQKSCMYKNYCNIFDVKDDQKTIYWFDYSTENRRYLDHIIIINTHLKAKNIDKTLDSIFFKNDTKAIPTDTFNGTKRTLELEVNRLHIDNCRFAMYDPDYILAELGGIVWYMEDKCQDKTKLGVLAIPYIEDLVNSEYSPLDSPAWLELQRLEALKDKYKENRLGTD
jgi:hypothetical protein